jgi:hypothetical protein
LYLSISHENILRRRDMDKKSMPWTWAVLRGLTPQLGSISKGGFILQSGLTPQKGLTFQGGPTPLPTDPIDPRHLTNLIYPSPFKHSPYLPHLLHTPHSPHLPHSLYQPDSKSIHLFEFCSCFIFRIIVKLNFEKILDMFLKLFFKNIRR